MTEGTEQGNGRCGAEEAAAIDTSLFPLTPFQKDKRNVCQEESITPSLTVATLPCTPMSVTPRKSNSSSCQSSTPAQAITASFDDSPDFLETSCASSSASSNSSPESKVTSRTSTSTTSTLSSSERGGRALFTFDDICQDDDEDCVVDVNFDDDNDTFESPRIRRMESPYPKSRSASSLPPLPPTPHMSPFGATTPVRSSRLRRSRQHRSNHHKSSSSSSSSARRRSTLTSDYDSPSLPSSSDEPHSSPSRNSSRKISTRRTSSRYRRKSRVDDIQETQPDRPTGSFSKSIYRALHQKGVVMWMLLIVALFGTIMTFITNRTIAQRTQRMRGQETTVAQLLFLPATMTSPSAGLRGQWVHEMAARMGGTTSSQQSNDSIRHLVQPKASSKVSQQQQKAANIMKRTNERSSSSVERFGLARVTLPAKKSSKQPHFEVQDRSLYISPKKQRTKPKRVVFLYDSIVHSSQSHPLRKVKLYPPDFTDNTQLYGILDSSDERLKTMELREPLVQGDCVPMQEWQTIFHPSCNVMHEVDVKQMDDGFKLFGTKGYWRHAWRLDFNSPGANKTKGHPDTVVLKTLKIEHRFEEAHYEHDRIDAVAMERLTSSPHVINIFGFCGHSVMTEFADGKRLGELADKSRKTPLARLNIARDIASGLADVHGIDGDGNATFVHLDINPANVVSVGGTLKLNDFNIGIIRRWNTTSNQPCGFPAQYPNPQWRSPEEARDEQNLTEKVDVFSLGHIFFRLICGHEPWNKLEPGGKPSKAEMNEKVKNGVLPFIPQDIVESVDPEIVAIRDVMLKCYTFDPASRPSAREIANALQHALDQLENKPAALMNEII